MTELRNPGVLLVSEAKYRRVIRGTGFVSIFFALVFFAAAFVFLAVGLPFSPAAPSVVLLGAASARVGVLTLQLAAAFPLVSGFRRAVTLSMVWPIVLWFVGAVVSLVLAANIADGVVGALATGFPALIVVFMANSNRLVLRTAAALIAPPATPAE